MKNTAKIFLVLAVVVVAVVVLHHFLPVLPCPPLSCR